MNSLVAASTDGDLLAVERLKNHIKSSWFLSSYFANMSNMMHLYLGRRVAHTACLSKLGARVETPCPLNQIDLHGIDLKAVSLFFPLMIEEERDVRVFPLFSPWQVNSYLFAKALVDALSSAAIFHRQRF